ncbi:MAG: metal ABC transporter permease, partial [Elusimicrobiaceae bacterium]|nr:metal ABC transporter permease [Elusimicrobiaceae bacterium]
CFDEAFAHTRGIPTQAINTVLILVTSVAVVLSFKVVGIFLISALIIIPPVSALLLARTFRQVLRLAVLLGVLSVWLGIYTSFVLDIPSGAAIILINLILLAGSYGWSRWGRSHA